MYAAPAGGAADIQGLVLTYFQTEGEKNDMGCTVAAAAEALQQNGASFDQVKQIVDTLVADGHLYSTIDDDHYKSTA